MPKQPGYPHKTVRFLKLTLLNVKTKLTEKNTRPFVTFRRAENTYSVVVLKALKCAIYFTKIWEIS
jgi:hypothetical protein